MIKDLTDIFRKGILNSADYDIEHIERKLNSLPYILCTAYDDWGCHWNNISLTDGKTIGRTITETYGYLSRWFPVAMLMENCPDNIRQLLEENGIITDSFSRRCSCDEDILKQYAPPDIDFRIIDDMKLVDGRISFDSVEFDIIASGCDYITPYDFDFYDIL